MNIQNKYVAPATNMAAFIGANENNPVTMSSLEIAEIASKEHKNVIRDIRVMLDGLADGADLSHVHEVKDARGYTAEFRLPKDLTLTLVTGYDVKRRHAINVRWLFNLKRRLQRTSLLRCQTSPIQPLLPVHGPSSTRPVF